MASYRKRGDKWEVAICLEGVRRSASFPSKREAAEWAAAKTVAIKTVQVGGVPDISLGAVFQQYAETVTPRKRGRANESQHLTRLMRDPIASVRLPELRPSHLAAWRDRRLSEVLPGSVLRDWSLLSHVFTTAINEWGYLKEHPLRRLQRPKAPPARVRRISENEGAQILLALGYHRTGEVKTARARVAAAFLFAIETGMRRGELLSLTWGSIKGSVAHLSMTKNGFPRPVSLSPEALRLLGQLPKDGESVFCLNRMQVQMYFAEARDRAGITNLHWHDTRHEAITRLAQTLSVPSLAVMVGTRDLKTLMIYYNETAEEISAKLAAKLA